MPLYKYFRYYFTNERKQVKAATISFGGNNLIFQIFIYCKLATMPPVTKNSGRMPVHFRNGPQTLPFENTVNKNAQKQAFKDECNFTGSHSDARHDKQARAMLYK